MTLLAINEDAVIPAISPNDGMLDEVYGESGYHYCGRSALECIARSLDAAGVSPTDVKRILDLPCGHGRVLRYLKAAFPAAEITACDLSRDAVDFCAATFGALPAYSADRPDEIPLARDAFDLIWVGSLFTHFDADRWPPFLDLFRSLLRAGGALVFTTSGREVYYRVLRDTIDFGIPYWRKTALLYKYERTGFGYVKYLGPDSSYGVSLSKPGWVLAQVERFRELRLVHAAEKSWATLQDVFTCVREPDWPIHRLPVPHFTFLKHGLREALAKHSHGRI